jgi:Fic family protein
MRKPAIPPDSSMQVDNLEFWKRLGAILPHIRGVAINGRYLHWHKLRYAKPPGGLSHEDWWLGIKMNRRAQYKTIPLNDSNGNPFHYLLVSPIPLRLHETDFRAGGLIQMPDQIINPETKDRYYVGSLIEEATRSSQLEGAATTRPIAKEMIQSGRPPRDRSERMILNNYMTMKYISSLKSRPLTKELVFDIHRRVTEGTLDDPTAAGRFRRDNEERVVSDSYGEIYHNPPPANQLEKRMQLMCDFANSSPTNPDDFIHPVIRSIILHFWLSYDHPFVDGNGRTARALFYWSMLNHNYWLCEFISISHIIFKQPGKYQRAFLYTENDENDLTYFILYHLEIMRKAIDQLHDYIRHKTEELHKLEHELRGISILNHRQRDLISHALRHPDQIYTVRSHQTSHNVVYETSRRDLNDLVERGLLTAKKIGKTWKYKSVDNLNKNLAAMK